MVIEIREIKEIRKKLGLTQGQLANMANVSQSLIAKIEAGRLDPTYSNATKIFEALGWTFNVESTLDVDSFVGKLAELNINDLEKENEVFSVIEGIAKLSE